MANCYYVTAHKATAVSFAVTGNFTSPTERNLIVAKNNRLEIYVVTRYGLRAVKEIEINGKICVLKIFRPQDKLTDALFVVTMRYNAMVLDYRKMPNGEFMIMTKAHGSVADKIGKPSENGFVCCVDPLVRMIGLRISDGLFKVIPLDERNSELRAFSIRFEEMEVIDVEFLYGCSYPTIVFIHQDTNGRHVKAREVSLKDKEFGKSPWKQDNIENEASLIIPLPEPMGGAIFVGVESILYHNGTTYVAVAPSDTRVQGSTFTCYTRLGDRGLMYILGDMLGRLITLNVLVEKNPDGSFTVKEPRVEYLGEVTIPECISYLDNGVLFIGSRFGDSQLIKLGTSSEGLTFISLKEAFVNLGPIVDMVVVDLERQGQGQLITCSGAFKEGSLKVIRNGIGIQENASIDLPGIKGIWSLRLFTHEENMHDAVVLSFVGYTRVLTLLGEEVEETDFAGFSNNKQTFFCGNIFEELIVQVTPAGARLISLRNKKLVTEWKPPADQKISVVACNGPQIVCAAGCQLFYMEIIGEEIILKKSHSFEHEVSCLDVSPFVFYEDENKKYIPSSYVAVSLWTNITAIILSLPELEEVYREPLGGEIIARSILMATFEEISYLLCALGDGSMFYFNMDKNTGALSDKKKVALGTQPIELKSFRSLSTTNVFACSDRPTVIYSSNKKLVFSNVNLKKVNHMCSINSEAYKDSLALATDVVIQIGTIDEIQKLHIRTIPLGESPRRITYQEETETFGLLTIRLDVVDNGVVVPVRNSASTQAHSISTSNSVCALPSVKQHNVELSADIEINSFLVIDQNTFEILHAHQFPMGEYAMSLESCRLGNDPNVYFAVGTAFVNPEESEPKTGRIILFLYEDGKLTQAYEKEVKGACYSLTHFNGKLLASVNSTVRLYEWTTEKDLRVECSHFNNIAALFLKTKGDFIVIGDLMRSITVLQHKSMEGTFEEIARDYCPNWMTMVDIIEDDTYIGAENYLNLFVTQKDGSATNDEDRMHMAEVGRFHLGDFVNVFRHGSLVMQHNTDTVIPVRDSILFGTTSGAIGMVMQIKPALFKILHLLQELMANILKPVGRIEHSDWRCVSTDLKCEPMEGFIDGDLIERFLDLTVAEMEEVADGFKNHPQTLPLGTDVTENKEIVKVDDIIKLVEDLTRIH